MIDRKKLEELARAATPGPWFASDWQVDDGENKSTVEARIAELLRPGQSNIWPNGVESLRIAECEAGERPLSDAAFIAAANPAAVLELLGTISEREAALAGVQSRMGGLIKEKAEAAPCNPAETEDELAVLLRLWSPLEDGENVHVVITRCRYGAPESLEQTNQHNEFLYDEQTCPTNWLGVAMIIEGSDTDPHGVFHHVQTIEIPMNEAGTARIDMGHLTIEEIAALFDKFEPVQPVAQPVQQTAAVVRQYRMLSHTDKLTWTDLVDGSGVEAILMQQPALYEFRTLLAERTVQQPAAVETIGKHKAFESAAKALHQDWTPEKVRRLIDVVDAYMLANTAPVPAAGVQGSPVPLFDRKLADLERRGYEVIGRILHKDGEYALFDSSCRWLTKPQYQRLMHEQDGSLFAAPKPDSGRDAALGVAVLRDSLQAARHAFARILSNVETGTVHRICTEQMQSIHGDLAKALLLAAHPANGAQADLSEAHRAVIAEAAQVLESAAAHNKSESRTVLAYTQQERADRLREVLLAAAPQKKEG